MLWQRSVLKYVDIVGPDGAEYLLDDLSQPICPEGRQNFVLDGNSHPLASELG